MDSTTNTGDYLHYSDHAWGWAVRNLPVGCTDPTEAAKRHAAWEEARRRNQLHADCPYCGQDNRGVVTGLAHICNHCGETFYASAE